MHPSRDGVTEETSYLVRGCVFTLACGLEAVLNALDDWAVHMRDPWRKKYRR